VKDTGLKGSIIECSDGHALNFLFPRRMAAPATPANLKQAEVRQSQNADRQALDRKLVEDRLAALAESGVAIRKKANEQGHLYDAVDAKDIADAADLPVAAIKLDKPIKEVGSFDVPVSFGEGFGKVSVRVEAE
jgi:large subunit ribosomal protein L9